MSEKCIGCGAILQTNDENKPGYRVKDNQVMCKRCFQIKHYNKAYELDLNSDDYLNVLRGAKPNSLIINIVDLLDFDGSFIHGLTRIMSSKDVILVGNKLDLLPESVHIGRTKQWLESQAKDMGLHPIAVEVLSAKEGWRMEKLVDLILDNQGNRDVYIVGCTNVGKSSLINALIREFVGEDDLITTSQFPGTTIDTIEIPMNDGYLIDTPGVINKYQFSNYLSESLRAVVAKKTIKPLVYQVEPGVSMFIGGFARLDFLKGVKTSFVFFKGNEIPIHKRQLKDADVFMEKHIGELLSPPTINELAQLGDFSTHHLIIQPDQDLVLAGLGFVSFNKKVEVDISLPKSVKYYVRESIF